MRFLSLILLILLTGNLCKTTEKKTMTENDYSKAEVIISDFSKKIPANLPSMKIPESFNETQAIKLLHDHYPDQTQIKFITDNFQLRVKHLESRYYSMVLCSIDGKQKIMEDISCTLSKVDYRYWNIDLKKQPSCEFENDWESKCN